MSKEIGARVLSVRTSTGLNQRDFAAELGVSSGGISQIESGKTMPSGDFLLRVYEKFSVDATWLLTGQGNALPQQPTASPSAEEVALLSDFRRSDAQGKAIIRAASQAAAAAIYESETARHQRRSAY